MIPLTPSDAKKSIKVFNEVEKCQKSSEIE
jgi:hypothetical protein